MSGAWADIILVSWCCSCGSILLLYWVCGAISQASATNVTIFSDSACLRRSCSHPATQPRSPRSAAQHCCCVLYGSSSIVWWCTAHAILSSNSPTSVGGPSFVSPPSLSVISSIVIATPSLNNFISLFNMLSPPSSGVVSSSFCVPCRRHHHFIRSSTTTKTRRGTRKCTSRERMMFASDFLGYLGGTTWILCYSTCVVSPIYPTHSGRPSPAPLSACRVCGVGQSVGIQYNGRVVKTKPSWSNISRLSISSRYQVYPYFFPGKSRKKSLMFPRAGNNIIDAITLTTICAHVGTRTTTRIRTSTHTLTLTHP